MKKYGAAAGIPEKLRHFHVLKHCCATHLLSNGFGVERVQDWIGHANIQSTMEYAKVTNARRDVVVRQQNVVVRWNGEGVEASRHFEYHVMKSYRQGSMKTTLRKEILLNYPLAVRAAGAPQFGSGSA